MTATPAPGLKHKILLTVEKNYTAVAYGNPGVEKIGEGTHERFIMDNLDLFLQKTRDKFQQG